MMLSAAWYWVQRANRSMCWIQKPLQSSLRYILPITLPHINVLISLMLDPEAFTVLTTVYTSHHFASYKCTDIIDAGSRGLYSPHYGIYFPSLCLIYVYSYYWCWIQRPLQSSLQYMLHITLPHICVLILLMLDPEAFTVPTTGYTSHHVPYMCPSYHLYCTELYKKYCKTSLPFFVASFKQWLT